MPRTLNDLAQQMDAISASISDQGNEVAKKIATAVVIELVKDTPADVGTALSNWQVSLNQPVISTIGAYVPSPPGKMLGNPRVWTHSVDPAITKQNNQPPTLQDATMMINSKQAGEAVWITNNLPYIEVLDRGSSKQVPAGFVERALLVGKAVSSAAARGMQQWFNSIRPYVSKP